MRRTCLLAALVLAACGKHAATNGAANAPAAPANTAAAAPAPSPRLAKIFTPDVLGSNVAYLETITGPAFRTDGPELRYKVDGCNLVVDAAAGKIDNIGIENYGPACSFPIAQYFAGGYDHPVPPLPTFGDIQGGLGGDYTADCLANCGNAADPVVSLTYQGSHADNFNGLYAAVSVDKDGPALSAYTDWGAQMTAKHGADYVVNGDYRTGDSLQDVAAKDFAKVAPTVIRVGQKLPEDAG
jgi:hypothetical protein